ncbi:hypothetical protein EZV62_000201 [Acer yangbiense]|uniref:Uncharacterized protein n=1 Tax=Acer yangbiense TaxID=1000413 RepID=A0A5C7IT87_9ROSI|nr:hypothetical protein EZV62_000201 [Acer yangbiense]
MDSLVSNLFKDLSQEAIDCVFGYLKNKEARVCIDMAEEFFKAEFIEVALRIMEKPEYCWLGSLHGGLFDSQTGGIQYQLRVWHTWRQGLQCQGRGDQKIPRDACHLACVSTTFRSAADSNVVWDRFLRTEYLSAISDPGPVSGLSKKELYIRSYYIPILNGKLKRIGVCEYCNNRPAGYLVESSKSSDYLLSRRDDAIVLFGPDRHHGKRDYRIKNVPDGDDADNFFDSDAFEINDRLLNENEKNYKNIIQEDRTEKEVAAAAAKEAYEQLKAGIEIKLATASNSRKAAKKAANEAYEDLNVVEENDVVVSNSGKERAAEAEYPENTSEATLRMLAKKVASENNNTKRRESESHCDNNGNKRRQESQDAFEIGELELEGYFDNGASVRSRRRGIWKPNGLRKCSRKLS